ncbi:MAG: helix-turn-helix domain-containing protein, partial [Candidatus Nanopelagicus sp.]
MAEKSSLQQVREAAGLTLEQISALTNIRPGVIKDLENNSVELCGGVAYARGHIRSIVAVVNKKAPKSLRVDADQLVADMEAAQSQDGRKIIERLAENNVADKPKEKKRMKFRTLATISAAVLSIGFVAQIAISNVSQINSDLAPVVSNEVIEQTKIETASTGVNLVVTGVKGK